MPVYLNGNPADQDQPLRMKKPRSYQGRGFFVSQMRSVSSLSACADTSWNRHTEKCQKSF
jgi:hypothetical protein